MTCFLGRILVVCCACLLSASQIGCSVLLGGSTHSQARPTGEFQYETSGRKIEAANPSFSADAENISLELDLLESGTSCQAKEKLDNGPDKTRLVIGSLIDASLVAGGAYVYTTNPCGDAGVLDDKGESMPCAVGGIGGLAFAVPLAMSLFVYAITDYGHEWSEYAPAECPPGEPAPNLAARVRLPDGRTVNVTTDSEGRVPPGAISLPAGAWKVQPEIGVAADGAEGGSMDLRPFLGELANLTNTAPARLHVTFKFIDDGDQILRAEEAATLRLTVTNTGKGAAYPVVKPVRHDVDGLEVRLPTGTSSLEPGESTSLDIALIAGRNLVDNNARLTVQVGERRGFDADPVQVELETRGFRPPKIVLSGIEVDDDNQGESSGNSNGLVEPGEQVEITVVVQNQGEGEARDVRLNLEGKTQGLMLPNASALALGDLKHGQVARKKVVLVVTKRYAGSDQLPVNFRLAERTGKYGASGRLPVVLRERTAAPRLVTVTAKGQKDIDITAANALAEVDTPFPLPAVAPNSNHWALVIGIEDYAKAPSATFTTRDAQRVVDTLRHIGVPQENMKVLLNSEATLASFRAALSWLANNVGQGDRVYFYFAGHGVPGTGQAQEAFLVPYDGDPNYAKETTLPLNAVKDRLEGLRAGEVIAMMDACFTGQNARGKGESLLSNARPMLPIIKTKAFEGKVSLLAAARSNQISTADESLQHGLFTNYLLLGLRGKADEDSDSRVSVGELHRFVAKQVTRHARRLNREQHPELKGPGDQWSITLGGK